MKSITQAPVLAFFDPEKEVTIQCDASQSGLGAVLAQEGKPIHYASRAMTTAEKNYAQVEKSYWQSCSRVSVLINMFMRDRLL